MAPRTSGAGTASPDVITDPNGGPDFPIGTPDDLIGLSTERLVDDEPVDAEIVEEGHREDGTPSAVVAGSSPPPSSTAVELHDGRRQLVAADEWADVEDGDLSPSGQVVIPLYQLNRKADGGFVNEDTGEVVREIDAVLMAKVDTRAWWPQAFGKGNAAPDCRSDDNVVPNVERSPAQQPGWEMPKQFANGQPPARTCAACPNSQWDGDNPPACTQSIEFLAFVPTSAAAGKVTRLRFSGMALSTARRYWDSFKTRLPYRPPLAFLTHITLEEQVTDNGNFLVPRFTKQDEFSVLEARPIIAARDERQLEWKAAVATDERPTVIDVDAGDPFADAPVADESDEAWENF